MKILTFMNALQWVEKKQSLLLASCILFSCGNILSKVQEDDFITHIQEFEQHMQNFQNNMMKSFEKNMQHTFHKFFDDFDARTAQLSQPNCPTPPCNNTSCRNKTSYYQSSSTLSFVTSGNSIKITENKNSNTTMYTIEVIDHHKHHKTTPHTEDLDPVTSLQELQAYIQANLQSCQAHAIVQECIHALTHEQKDKIVTAEITSSGPHTTYTIQIDTTQPKEKEKNHDHEVHEIEEEDEVKSRKKKRQITLHLEQKIKKILSYKITFKKVTVEKWPFLCS